MLCRRLNSSISLHKQLSELERCFYDRVAATSRCKSGPGISHVYCIRTAAEDSWVKFMLVALS